MARIVYSALVESINGSIKGTTFQRNRYGYSVKGKPAMVRPSKLSQQLRKVQFASNSRKWRELSEGDRTLWNSYAENFPIPTRLNPDANLSGFDYFLKYHGIASAPGGNPFLEDPGTTQNPFEIDQIEVILDTGDLFCEVAMVDSDSTMRMNVYMTPQIPLGREFINVTPRFVGNANESSGTFQADCTTGYENAFGVLPSLGQWIGIRLAFYRSDNAQMVEISPTQFEVIT